jgi:hypothetical protein
MFQKIYFKPTLPFHFDAAEGKLEAIKSTLISSPEGINQPDTAGITALAFSVLNGQVETTTFLLSKGADKSLTYQKGLYKNISLMHIAVASGSVQMVELLVNNELNVNAAIELTNITPMAIAVDTGKLEIARFLIHHGAMPYLEFPEPFNVSPKRMKFFQDQITYRAKGDWDGIMRDFYVENPVMISYDFFLKGRESIKQHFIEGNAEAGKLLAFSVDQYIEAEDYMMMRSNVLSENTLTKACDTYYFQGDKVFLFAAQTKAKNWEHLTKEWALRWMF